MEDQKLMIPLSMAHRSYKFLVLTNGVRVLVISDPLSLQAGAAVSVASGAFNDPLETPGLAHLCEHMILLGSKSYPNVNPLQKVLKQSKEGLINAYTTGDCTCFYYQLTLPDCNLEVLDQSLKILGDLMSRPLFDAAHLKKEILAVHNEHLGNCSKPNKIMLHGMRLLSLPESKFHRFATGNLSSFSSSMSSLRKQLVRYFYRYFKPDNISLVVKGPQSINMISKLVSNSFGSPVMSYSSSSSSFSSSTLVTSLNQDSPFPQKTLNKCISIKKRSNSSHHVRVFFPVTIETMTSLFLSAVASMLQSVLENHLLDHQVECFVSELDSVTSSLTVHVESKNVVDVGRVLCLILSFVSRTFSLDSKATDVAQYLSQKFIISHLNLLYKVAPSRVMDELCDYAEYLLKNPHNQKWIFDGEPNWSDVNGFEGLYQESEKCRLWWLKQARSLSWFVANFINLNNFNVVVYGQVDDNLVIEIEEEKEDPFFLFHYRISSVNIENLILKLSGMKFSFTSNRFIPKLGSQFKTVNERFDKNRSISEFSPLGFNNNRDSRPSTAVLVAKSDRSYVWVKKETDIKYFSRSIMTFDVSTGIENSSMTTILNEIFCEVVRSLIDPQLSISLELGYSWSVRSSSLGDTRLTVTIGGYRDKCGEMLQVFFKLLIRLKYHAIKSIVTESRFTEAVNKVKKCYDNLKQRSSFEVAVSASVMIVDKAVSFEDRLACLSSVSYQQFLEFVKSFFNDLHCHVLIQTGSPVSDIVSEDLFMSIDILETDSSGVSLRTSSDASVKNTPLTTSKLTESLHVPPGNFYFEAQSTDMTHCLSYYLQTGSSDDLYITTLTSMVELLISKDAVTELRTKRQLGYTVLTGIRKHRTTLGVHITIVSPYSPKSLETNVNGYLSMLERNLRQMTETEFEKRIKIPFLKKYLGDKVKEENQMPFLENETLTLDETQDLSAATVYRAGDTWGSLNSSMGDQHLNLWGDIVRGRMESSKSLNELDMSVAWVCNKAMMLDFWKRKISPQSIEAAKLSIWVTPSDSGDSDDDTDYDDESKVETLACQVEVFLFKIGLQMPRSLVLEKICESKGDQSMLMKDIMSYFVHSGEKLKVAEWVLGNAVKTVARSFSLNRRSGAEAVDRVRELKIWRVGGKNR